MLFVKIKVLEDMLNEMKAQLDETQKERAVFEQAFEGSVNCTDFSWTDTDFPDIFMTEPDTKKLQRLSQDW